MTRVFSLCYIFPASLCFSSSYSSRYFLDYSFALALWLSHRRDGIKPARRNDFRARALCLGVVLVDDVPHPERLAGEVTVVHPRARAGGHELVPVPIVRTDRRDDNLVCAGVEGERRGRRGEGWGGGYSCFSCLTLRMI